MSTKRMGVVVAIFVLLTTVILVAKRDSFWRAETSAAGAPQVDTQVEAIQKTVATYCELAKREDLPAVRKLIAMTPPQYWEYRRQKIRSRRGDREQTETIPPNGGAADPSGNAGLARMNYEELTGLTLLAFRGLNIPASDTDGPWIKDQYTRIRLAFQPVNGKLPTM
ncbi:MAG: hypothetical protein ACJ73D_04275, partial [Pyrinomonadaceae bacterium]